MNRNPSLERLISPDRTDVLPSVNHPPRRLFVTGTALLAVLACAWLMLGAVDTRIKGRCILLNPQGMDNLTASVEGRVDGLSIKTGERVAAGQVLATLVRPEFTARLNKAQARLEELNARRNAASPLIDRSARLGRGAAASELATLAERLRTGAERQQQAQRRVQSQQALFEQGLATRQSLLAAQDQQERLAIDQAVLQSRARQLSFQDQEEQRGLDGERGQLAMQVAEAERELALLRKQQHELMQVRAPHAGTVIEVKTQNGLALAQGGEIATIERSDGNDTGTAPARAPLMALVFVRAAEGKLVRGGMTAEITPTNVKRQEFGYIRANIASVADFPSSRAAIAQRLGNTDVAHELAGAGVATQLQATLLARPDGTYQWSGAARLPPTVYSGSMCGAEIVVREQHPIDLLWPMLKKIAGVN